MPGCSITVVSEIQAEIIACKHREIAVECGIPPLPHKCRKGKEQDKPLSMDMDRVITLHKKNECTNSADR